RQASQSQAAKGKNKTKNEDRTGGRAPARGPKMARTRPSPPSGGGGEPPPPPQERAPGRGRGRGRGRAGDDGPDCGRGAVDGPAGAGGRRDASSASRSGSPGPGAGRPSSRPRPRVERGGPSSEGRPPDVDRGGRPRGGRDDRTVGGDGDGRGASSEKRSGLRDRFQPPSSSRSLRRDGSEPRQATGGDARRPPCRFFAGGTCHHGDRCRFSHERGGRSRERHHDNYGGGSGRSRDDRCDDRDRRREGSSSDWGRERGQGRSARRDPSPGRQGFRYHESSDDYAREHPRYEERDYRDDHRSDGQYGWRTSRQDYRQHTSDHFSSRGEYEMQGRRGLGPDYESASGHGGDRSNRVNYRDDRGSDGQYGQRGSDFPSTSGQYRTGSTSRHDDGQSHCRPWTSDQMSSQNEYQAQEGRGFRPNFEPPSGRGGHDSGTAPAPKDEYEARGANPHPRDSGNHPDSDPLDHESYRGSRPYDDSEPPSLRANQPTESAASTNEELREELERQKLEKEIAKEKLEKEKLKRELRRMEEARSDGSSDDDVPMARKKEAPRATTAANHDGSDDDVLARKEEAPRATTTANHNGSDDDVPVARKEEAPRATTAPNRSAANLRSLDDPSSDEEEASKPPAKKTRKRKAKASSPKNKKPNRRKRTGQAKLATKTKKLLREAQKSNDEQRKHKLLQAYEEDLAEANQKMHKYTESDLLSSGFKPKIVDHLLVDGGVGKFLVKWVRNKFNEDASCCRSWVSHDKFLFPSLAKNYISGVIRKRHFAYELDGLKKWKEDCEERARCLNCLNTFGLDALDDGYASLMEVDFCCFLCNCPWDHPLKRTVRNDMYGIKFHRPCCHGFQDKEDLESFMSPVGKVQEAMIENAGKDDGDEEVLTETCNAGKGRAPKGGSEVDTFVEGNLQEYQKCLQDRSADSTKKRDAVVLCVNAGIGSVAVALKCLNIKVATIIHVEADRVAQHVIRSSHDCCYGETKDDDGIVHVVGLYESLEDVAKDPAKMVQKFGVIDMIFCSPRQGTSSADESAEYANQCFELINKVRKLNQLQNFDQMFYCIETLAEVKDHLTLQADSHCICGSTMFVFNWPIPTEREKSIDFNTNQGFLRDTTLEAGKCLSILILTLSLACSRYVFNLQ
ncbi:hypothetical protein ACHAWF_015678, partial [Thalassiosira exigua]